MALPDTSWMWRGACRRQDPELWHPDGDTAPYKAQIEKAKAVCAGCPVVLNCIAHILAHPTEVGIWGGMTEQERAELRQGFGEKRCTGCEEVKPLSAFYRRPALPGGVRHRCKKCENSERAVGLRQERAAQREARV